MDSVIMKWKKEDFSIFYVLHYYCKWNNHVSQVKGIGLDCGELSRLGIVRYRNETFLLENYRKKYMSSLIT